jgi:DNA-binding transcriptional ArsR family regulator
MTPESLSAVFAALAHPVRRKILDVVKDRSGCSVHDVCDYFEISRIAVLKHLRALERARLIVSRKEGRTRQLYFNAVPIQMIYDRWTSDYSALWASKLTRIKYRIESAAERRKEHATSAHRQPPRRKHA